MTPFLSQNILFQRRIGTQGLQDERNQLKFFQALDGQRFGPDHI